MKELRRFLLKAFWDLRCFLVPTIPAGKHSEPLTWVVQTTWNSCSVKVPLVLNLSQVLQFDDSHVKEKKGLTMNMVCLQLFYCSLRVIPMSCKTMSRPAWVDTYCIPSKSYSCWYCFPVICELKLRNGLSPKEVFLGLPHFEKFWSNGQTGWTYSRSSFGRWVNDSGSRDSMLLKCRYLEGKKQ